MNGNNYYEDYQGMVKQIASEYSKKFRLSDREDIQQELWVWFLEHPNKIETWYELEDQKEASKLFAKSLRNAAYDYCLKEKAVREGYNYEDAFFYNKSFIKAMLPMALSSETQQPGFIVSSEIKATKSPSEGGDWMVYRADIQAAFERLDGYEQDLISAFYVDNMEGSKLHEIYGEEGTTSRATMMKANRALNKMVKFLGGSKPFNDKDEVKVNQNDM